MLSLAECRKLLGDEARDLSDADVEQLRHEAYGFANLIMTQFLERRRRARKDTHPAKEPTG